MTARSSGVSKSKRPSIGAEQITASGVNAPDNIDCKTIVPPIECPMAICGLGSKGANSLAAKAKSSA